MKSSLVVILGLLCAAGNAAAQGRFELFGEIHFADSLFLSGVGHLDIGANGDLLLTDRVGQRLYLFDAAGGLIKEMDPTECHPGYQMSPLGAALGRGFIVMRNAATWGFLFGRDGRCVSDVHETFRTRLLMSVAPGDSIVSVMSYPAQEPKLLLMDATGRLVRERELFPVPFPNATARFEGGGLIALDDGFILAFSTSPRIYRLAQDGRLLDTWDEWPDGYRALEQDIPARLGLADHSVLGRAFLGFSGLNGLWRLREDRVIAVFRQPGSDPPRQAWLVYDLAGTLIARGDDLVYGFSAFRDGIGYRAVMGEGDAGPYLETWRWVED